ncbi:Dak1-domain-containing protein [Dendrothele bispora CBS 962.96]|uniref:Dak1-domain-containing protein n=1 Tax=Dendrothele bispora (strain CBS 962.96) TaxID=1314807 RepID=A0A4S8KV65_DENBC|nr:Dak1-domain-containing protein [Dendrothele bispora CBS 962.96]
MYRHIFEDHVTNAIVVRALRGLVASHPTLELLESIKTVIDKDYEKDKVVTISGGGAGHEPGFASFVGRGLLTAAVSGDVFASPSAKQVYGAVKALPSDKGTILIITNYTGDNLHFGLACQQARADGIQNIAILPVGDDVSVGRTKGALVGRRAMAGTMLVCKILGAASTADWSFDDVLALGKACVEGLASIGCTLGHCHVPGRIGGGGYPVVEKDTVEIGLGLHNEPGMWTISPQPSTTELVSRMIKYILNQDDPERSFVPFEKGDRIVLLVNNMGGVSVLEMWAVVDEVLDQLESNSKHPLRKDECGLVVEAIYCGPFLTSLNAVGFSITVMNLTHTVRVYNSSLASCSNTEQLAVEDLLVFLDAKHTTAAWQNTEVYSRRQNGLEKRSRAEKVIKDVPSVNIPSVNVNGHQKEAPKLFVSSQTLRNVIKSGAEELLASEPDLTRWDTIVGDGDCGETCAAGATAVLKALDEGLGDDGDLVRVLRELTEIVDDTCGGTLGAIYSIFLAALTAEVQKESTSPNVTVDMQFWGRTTTAAIETLKQSTKARVGHRTVMDALIPFVEELSTAHSKGQGFEEVMKKCREGGEGTRVLKAKLGRATYVGEGNHGSEGGLPPDPGAMSLVRFVEGMGKILM